MSGFLNVELYVELRGSVVKRLGDHGPKAFRGSPSPSCENGEWLASSSKRLSISASEVIDILPVAYHPRRVRTKSIGFLIHNGSP